MTRTYPCCIHCEHDGETDPEFDGERHVNPCQEPLCAGARS